MDGEYTVRITAQAIGQLREITNYISTNLQAPDTALRLLDTLNARLLRFHKCRHALR